MKASLFKTLVFTHRYVGIAIGWLMLMWCLSGLVMLYVEYPELRERERLAHLEPLQWQGCCVLPEGLAADTRITAFNVEMLAGAPLLRVTPESGAQRLLDMKTGAPINVIPASALLQVAAAWQPVAGKSVMLDAQQMNPDQWTVYARYRSHRPLAQVALNDEAGTELYVSGVTGEAVQKTDRVQRFWNWLGAVPHWLYFTAIRQHTALWNNLVIYSSLLGCFLTVFGLYLGVWQLRRKSDGHLHSPYKGWKYWHHVPGLVFGVLVLTWVFSGLMSMQPWGFLESDDFSADVRRVRGELPTWSQVQTAVMAMPDMNLPADTVRVAGSVLHGQLFLIATDRTAQRTRLTVSGAVAPLAADEVTRAGKTLSATSIEWLHEEDAYYYALGGDEAPLPVLRVRLPDDTRYYLDATTGGVLMKIDDAARWYRWLHLGLHRMDFTAWMRVRPVWDAWMWTLMLGVSAVALTGFWLGVRRLRR